MLRVNILAEEFIGKANGVYTAFVQAVESLKGRDDIKIEINSKIDGFDVIHSHTIGVDYVFRSRAIRDKLVVSAHVVPDSFIGSLIFSRLWQPIAKWYLKFVYNRAKLVVAVSPVVKQELEKIGVTSRIEVLCNSVDREKFKPDAALRETFRKKLGLSESDFVALAVGQIQPRKGVGDFIAVAKKMPNVKFLWVGGRPYGRLTADYAHMTELVETAPPNVIFAGTVELEDMPGYYAASDVYFFPSLQENFAYATIEASSVKLPLLLRDNPEYPSSLFTHYLCANDADGFAHALEKLVNDPEHLAKWQSESDTLASKYEINTYVERLIAMYRDVAALEK